jgi:hypothetical protein
MCFGFVGHLQADHTIVVRAIYDNAVNGFGEISSYITMEYHMLRITKPKHVADVSRLVFI